MDAFTGEKRLALAQNTCKMYLAKNIGYKDKNSVNTPSPEGRAKSLGELL